jgi:hypothetical protein
MFAGCRRLERVELGPGVTEVCHTAFAFCVALRRIDLSCLAADAVIGKEAFLGSGLVEVGLPAKLRKVAARAFAACVSLVSVRFPLELDELGSDTFEGCSSLRTLALGDVGKWDTTHFCEDHCIERLELIGTVLPVDKTNQTNRWLADGARVVSKTFAGQTIGRLLVTDASENEFSH